MENETSTVHRSPKKGDNKINLLIALGAVVVILVIVAVANFGGSIFNFKKNLSPEEASAKALDFINTNLVSAGTTATISEITDYNDSLYKLTVVVGTNNIESFISKDGKEFFPQVMNIAELAANTGIDGPAASTASAAPVVPANITKSDKPVVELFVMSECPYGLQMEKGMLPVANALKDKIDLQIKFVNYAMHGEKEVREQIRQYCISKEEESKYLTYLTCYSKSGDAVSCGSEASINESKISSCFDKTDKQYKIMADLADRNTWSGSFPSFAINDSENKQYGVQGSPTLVINGSQVESGRDSASLLATVCAAFNNAPSECDTQLDSATPAPGFGTGTAAATGSNAAECAPVQ